MEGELARRALLGSQSWMKLETMRWRKSIILSWILYALDRRTGHSLPDVQHSARFKTARGSLQILLGA